MKTKNRPRQNGFEGVMVNTGFNANAQGQNNGGGPQPPPVTPTDPDKYANNTETSIFGTGGENLTEDERARRRAQYILEMQKLKDEEEADRKAKQQKAAAAAAMASANQRQQTMLGNIYNYMGMGIRDKGDWLNIRLGHSAREISDRQLQAMILTAVLEKGWDTLYFYKGRSAQLDQQMTARANMMLAQMTRPGQPLQGMQDLNAVRIRPKVEPDPNNPGETRTFVEPWNKGMLRGLWHENVRPIENTLQTATFSFKNAVSGFVNTSFTDLFFHKPAKPQNPGTGPAPGPGPGGGAVP